MSKYKMGNHAVPDQGTVIHSVPLKAADAREKIGRLKCEKYDFMQPWYDD